MTVNLQQFINRVQAFDLKGAKDFTMPIRDAKAMHADLTRLLLELQEARELKSSAALPADSTEVIEVRMDGGSFK